MKKIAAGISCMALQHIAVTNSINVDEKPRVMPVTAKY
jgi:hypothetical protein